MSVIAASKIDRPAGRRAVELGVRAMEVAGQALGIGETGERTEVGPLRSFERGVTAPAAVGGQFLHEPQVLADRLEHLGAADRSMAGHDDLRVEARSQSSEASQPATEPISANGVPPLNTRSPTKRTEQSGSQTTTSSVGVGRASEVVQLDPSLVDEHIEPALERHGRRRERQLAPSRSARTPRRRTRSASPAPPPGNPRDR